MFIDASVIVAILAREEDAETLAARIDEAETGLATSPLAMVEACLGLAKAKSGGRRPTPGTLRAAWAVVDAFVATNGMAVTPIGGETARAAVEAIATWGKLVGHPAGLNLGDAFAYASAREHGLPLLYKGNDFARTDAG